MSCISVAVIWANTSMSFSDMQRQAVEHQLLPWK